MTLRPEEISMPTGSELDGLSRSQWDEAPWGLVELDARGHVVSYNRTESRMTGISRSDAVGRAFFDELAPCTSVPEFRDRFFRGVARGALDETFEFDFNFVLQPVRVLVKLVASNRPNRFWLATNILTDLTVAESPAARRAWQRNVRRDLDLSSVDESECEAEPIQTPGALQPFGGFLAIDVVSRRIAAVGEGLERYLPVETQHVLDAPFEQVLPSALHAPVTELCAGPEPSFSRHVVLQEHATLPLDVLMHRWAGRVLVELLPRAFDGDEVLLELHRASRFIDEESVDKVWQTACDAVAKLSGFERVLGYEMEESGAGVVVAECLSGEMPSLLGLSFPASDIPAQARRLYAHNRIRYCPNVSYVPAPILASENNAPVDLSFSTLRSMSPYHLQYQRNMGVFSSLSVSIVVAGVLRGMLIAHHHRPKSVSLERRIACEMLGRHIEYALSARWERRRLEARGRAAVAYADVIREVSAWGMHGPPRRVLLRALVEMFDADGVAIVVDDVVWSSQPEQVRWIRRLLQATAGLASDAPHQSDRRPPDMDDDDGTPAGFLLVAPRTSLRLQVVAFRFEAEAPTIWGRGKTSLPGAIKRWEESRRGISRPWGVLEMEHAHQLHRDLSETLGPLVETRRLLETTIDEARIAVVLCKKDTTIAGHNPAALELFGMTEESIAGLTLGSLVEGWRPSEGLEPELRARHANGEPVPVRVHTVAPEIGPVSWMVYLQDLRPLREMERQLTEAKRIEESANLVSGLAHEVNNTLAVVVSQAEMLERAPKLGVEAQDLVMDLLSAANDGARLARDMLAFARAGRESASTTACLVETVRDAARVLDVWVGTQVSLELELAGERLVVPLSSGQIQQILFNLVANAKDAMATPGVVRIRVTRSDGEALLEVTDQGSGIPQELVDRVFEPFFTTKPRGVGTGLGLWLVAGLVRRADGSVSARNETVGATVAIRLPLVDDALGEQTTPRQRKPATRAMASGSARILLVEDRQALLKAMSRMLRSSGFEVDCAADGREAWEIFQVHRPAVIITDYAMPKMNGLELIEAVASTGVPCVLLTGEGFGRDLPEFENPVEVLTKPVEVRTLLGVVSALLAEHSSSTPEGQS